MRKTKVESESHGELIRVQKNEGKETVNARELHEFLEVQTRFNDWIKARIDKYGFVDGIDFAKVTEKIVTPGGAQDGNSYYLSLDMAKELSMVENNEHGRRARRYFIEVEKRAREESLLSYKKDRRKAADTRNYFTDILKDHGCTKPGHYIQITKAMKRSLGIPVDRKKDKYELKEILRTMAAEALAALNIDVNNAQGYIECRRESEKAGSTVAISARSAVGEIDG